jgi:hypothetical protein
MTFNALKTHEAVLTMLVGLERGHSMLWLFVQICHEAWMVQHREVLDHPNCVRHTRIGDSLLNSPHFEFLIRRHPSNEEEWMMSVDYAENEGKIFIGASREEDLKTVIERIRRFVDDGGSCSREYFYRHLRIEIDPVANPM